MTLLAECDLRTNFHVSRKGDFLVNRFIFCSLLLSCLFFTTKTRAADAVKASKKGAKKNVLVFENLAAGKKASASQSESGRPPSDAVDNNTDTRWCAPDNSAGHSWQVDLGKPQEITGVRILWESDQIVYQFKVDGSTDGKTWKTLSDQTKKAQHPQDETLKSASKAVRHVRITFTGLPKGNWASFFEFQVLGTKKVKQQTVAIAKNSGKKGGGQKRRGGHGMKAPEGFSVTMYATSDKISYPVCVAATPGGDVYIGVDENGSLGKDPKRNQLIVRCRDTNDDGQADEFQVFADKVGSVRGIFPDGKSVWALHPPLLRVFHDDDGDGKADRNETLLEGLGTDALRKRGADHCTNGFRVGIDGWLYIAVGDFGFTNAKAKDGSTLQLMGGGIVRIRPNGSELELYARGLRNIYDVAVDPLLNTYTRDNTNDGGGWNVRLSHIVQTGNYGYPMLFKNFGEDIIQPLKDYGGGSPTGSLFVDEGAVPDGFGHALYTCDWGRNVVYRHVLPHSGAGYKAHQEPFVSIPRPTDMDIDASGRMYITSWKNGAFAFKGKNVGFVARVAPIGSKQKPFPDLGKADEAGLLKLMQAPSHVTRLHTQREILRRGDKPVLVKGLESLATSHNSVAVRVAAMFTLKQMQGAGATKLLVSLTDDAKVRQYALRALADRKSQSASVPTKPFVKALKDTDPRVRLQAIIGLSRLGRTEIASAIIPLSADADPLIAHAAVKALIELRAVEASLAGLGGKSEAVVSGSARALAGMHSQRGVEGLLNRLANNASGNTRLAILKSLARLYHIEGPWKGQWWGTRPDTRGPYYRPTKWAATAKIEAALRREAAGGSSDAVSLLRVELPRNRVSTKGWEFGSGPVKLDLATVLRQDRPRKDALPMLIAAAGDAKQDAALRNRAIGAIRRAQGDAAPSTVIKLLAESAGHKETALAEARRYFVFDAGNGDHVDLFAKKIDGGSAEQRRLAWAVLVSLANNSLADTKARATATALVDAAWNNSKQTSDLLSAIAETGFPSYDDQVVKLTKSPDAAIKVAADAAAKSLHLDGKSRGPVVQGMKYEKLLAEVKRAKGDVTLGARLFARQRCIACHTVSPDQTPIGPFLGGIAKRYNTDQLVESIVKPSAKVAQGFATQSFITDDGKTHTGFVTREAADEIQLRDAQGREKVLRRDRIEQRRKQTISMMPEGLVNNLTPADLAALMAYLASLKDK